MTIKRMISAAVATAALATAAAAQAGVPIVQDGDFTPTAAAAAAGVGYATYGAGYNGTAMGPWTVTGSVDLIGSYWQAPTAGGGSIDLDGVAPGGISQNLGILAAGNYDLTFYLSANPDGAPTVKTLGVSVGGVAGIGGPGSLVAETFNPTTSGVSRSDMNYVLETVRFASNGVDPTTLSFLSGDANSPYGPVIGGVSVAAVPEPATWAMLILGVGMLGIAARRRREGVALAA